MIINLSDTAANEMMDALARLMDGGQIELLSEDRRTLAVLKLSNPATDAAASGELEFNRIGEEDAALALGTAQAARIVSAEGGEIFTCDVGDTASDAVIKLNTVQIFPNGPVRIKSFRLAMP